MAIKLITRSIKDAQRDKESKALTEGSNSGLCPSSSSLSAPALAFEGSLEAMSLTRTANADRYMKWSKQKQLLLVVKPD